MESVVVFGVLYNLDIYAILPAHRSARRPLPFSLHPLLLPGPCPQLSQQRLPDLHFKSIEHALLKIFLAEALGEGHVKVECEQRDEVPELEEGEGLSRFPAQLYALEIAERVQGSALKIRREDEGAYPWEKGMKALGLNVISDAGRGGSTAARAVGGEAARVLHDCESMMS